MLSTQTIPVVARAPFSVGSDSRGLPVGRSCLEPAPRLLCFGRLKGQQTAILQPASDRRLHTASDPSRRVGSPPPQSSKKTSEASPVRVPGTTVPLAGIARKKQSIDAAVNPSFDTASNDHPVIFQPSLLSPLLKLSAREEAESRSALLCSPQDPTPDKDAHANSYVQQCPRLFDAEKENMNCAKDGENVPNRAMSNSHSRSRAPEPKAVIKNETVVRRAESQIEQRRRVGSPPPLSKVRSGSASSVSPLRSRLSDKVKWTPIMSSASNSYQPAICQSREPSEDLKEQGATADFRQRGRSPDFEGDTLRHLRLSCEAVSRHACPRNSITPGGSSTSSKASTPDGRRYPSLRAQNSFTTFSATTSSGMSGAGRERGHGTPEQRRTTQRENKRLTPERSWRTSVDVKTRGVPSTPRPRVRPSVTSETSPIQETVVQSLLRTGFLSHQSVPWSHDDSAVCNDIDHVRNLYSSQLPDVPLLGVYRIKHDGHSILYRAVQDTMESKTERILWHGTAADCVRNITLNGFNRNYCGRHGLKLGHGSYFSASAQYSMRFCDKKASRRYIFLAKVLVGAWTKGDSDLKEAPLRDYDGLLRYDSVVDSVDVPRIFCIFRDYQALPLYLLELGIPCS